MSQQLGTGREVEKSVPREGEEDRAQVSGYIASWQSSALVQGILKRQVFLGYVAEGGFTDRLVGTLW